MSAATVIAAGEEPQNLVQTNFPTIAPESAMRMLIKRMLYEFADSSEEMRTRCEAAYAKIFSGAKMHRRLEGEIFAAVYLHGPPGHGKTSVCRSAAKLVAKELGLRFLDNPGEEVIPGAGDFYFISQEMSGENSKMEFGGMPTKKTVTSEDGTHTTDYMSKLPSERLAKAHMAAASVLLFDDFANAAPPIQNIALSITREKRFQGINLGNLFVALTGNLGGLDGTNTSALSNALLSRCANFYFEDSFREFEDRMRRKYNDSLADAGILAYLEKNKSNFASKPAGRNSPFPCSRTWESVFPIMRSLVNESRTSGISLSAYMRLMETEVQATIGKEVGKDFAAHMRAVLSEAEPMARDLVENGKLDEKKFTEKIGNITTPQATAFCHQFASSLADHIANKVIAHEPDYAAASPYVKNFARGLMQLPAYVIGFASEILRKRLVYHSKTWYNEIDQGMGSSIAPWRSINPPMAVQFYRDVAQDKRAEPALLAAFSDAFSSNRVLNQAPLRVAPAAAAAAAPKAKP